MDPIEKAFFEAAGIPVFTEAEFLQLTPEQTAIVETKVRLSYALRRARQKAGLTQDALARKLDTYEPAVTHLETAHKSVTIDLLMRALLAAGVSLEEIGQEITRGGERLRSA